MANPSSRPPKHLELEDGLVAQFLDSVWAEDGLSRNTLKAYGYELQRIAKFMAPVDWVSATESHLREYLVELHRRGVRAAASRRTTVIMRRYFSWLAREHVRADDPCLRLAVPKLPPPFPKALGARATTALLEAPDRTVSIREQLRDRAMLELAYGSGLRVSELLDLKDFHLDLAGGALRVMGKGAKERMVPMSESAVDAVKAYLANGRPAYAKPGISSNYLFLTRLGKKMTPSGFWRHLRTLALAAGIEPSRVSPHVLRHTFATDLMMGGADLRVIQMLLGHASIGTTAVYLRQDQRHLRELVKAHHPRG